MMAFVRISIFTRHERNDAISLIRQAIGACGGWIVDHSLFSNLLATINFELPADKVDTLIAKLHDAGFKPEIGSSGPADAPGRAADGKAGDLRGQISLSFIHDEPDMRREVPPFG